MVNDWCWCQRTGCKDDELFLTLPAYLAQQGYVTSGTGKIFHPDACTRMHQPDFGAEFAHANGDDKRAWNHGTYGVEGRLEKPFDGPVEQNSEEQFGSIPGPLWPVNNFTTGPSWSRSPLTDEEQTDGQLATDALARLNAFKAKNIGKDSVSCQLLRACSVQLSRSYCPLLCSFARQLVF